jgi:hypothetical protein
MAEFCTHRPGRLHLVEPWGGLKKPEMRGIEFSMKLANPLNLTRLVPA